MWTVTPPVMTEALFGFSRYSNPPRVQLKNSNAMLFSVVCFSQDNNVRSEQFVDFISSHFTAMIAFHSGTEPCPYRCRFILSPTECTFVPTLLSRLHIDFIMKLFQGKHKCWFFEQGG